MKKNKKFTKKLLAILLSGTTSISALAYFLEKSNKNVNEYLDEKNCTTQEDIIDITSNDIYKINVLQSISDTNFNKAVLTSALEIVLSQKNFSEEVKRLYRNIFNNIFDNYDDYFDIYKEYNFPTKKEYISMLLNNINENVDDVVLLEEGYDLADSYGLEGNGLYREDIKTIVVLKDEDTESVLLHETAHPCDVNQEYSCMSMYNILCEGHASVNETFLNNVTTHRNNCFTQHGDMQFTFYGSHSTNYALYSRYYNMLGTMIGFKDLMNCKANNYDEYYIAELINSKTVLDGYTFINNMKYICDNLYASDLEFNTKVIELEQMYLNFIKSQCLKIDSKEAYINTLDLYRHFLYQYGITIENNGHNITKEVLYNNEIEKILFDKAMEYNVFENAEVIMYLLRTSNDLKNDNIYINTRNIQIGNFNDSIIIKDSNDFMVQVISNNESYYENENKDITFNNLLSNGYQRN